MPISDILSFFRRKILRSPAERWDHKYKRGSLSDSPEESARLDAVIALIATYHTVPTILELGCGKAEMLRRMTPDSYRSFTGVDISRLAISGARPYETERARFLLADMHSFVPERSYDVIVFNESLYYANDPCEVLSLYSRYLNEGGSLIVTAFENKYSPRFWTELGKSWQATQRQRISEHGNHWQVAIYRSLPAAGQDLLSR